MDLYLPSPYFSLSFEITNYKHGSLSRIKFPRNIFHRWSRISMCASTHIASDDFLVYIRAYRVVTRMSNPTNNRWISARRYTGHFAACRETFFTLNPEIVCAVAPEYWVLRNDPYLLRIICFSEHRRLGQGDIVHLNTSIRYPNNKR